MLRKKNEIKFLKIALWASIISFVLILSLIFLPVPSSIKRTFFPFTAILIFILFVFGIFFIVLAYKSKKIKGILKKYLLITGFSSSGILVGIILHNFFYRILIYLFGKNFWIHLGLKDEPIFFILGLFVCPLIFIIGITGSIIQLKKQKLL